MLAQEPYAAAAQRGYFVIYPGRRQVPPPLRALIDTLRAQRTGRRPVDPGMVFPGTPAKL